MAHLKGRVAVITGASSGIGLAIADRLAEEGMALAICARNRKRLERAASQLRDKGATVVSLSSDVSRGDQVRDFFKQTMDSLGRIDLLVNNAGVGRHQTISKMTEAEWEAVQAVNLKGVFLCTRAALPIMKRQASGYVINIASLAGKSGFGGAAAYSASKFGVVGLTQSLLEEAIDSNIRATVICPGYVATPMVRGVPVPADEMIPAEDIAELVRFLLHLSEVTVIKEVVVERKGAINT